MTPFLQFNFKDPPVNFKDPPASGGVCFESPVEIIEASTVAEVRPALRRVQAAAGRGLHAAGFVAYEAAPAFDPAFVVRPGCRMPLVWFGLFTGPCSGPPPAAFSCGLEWRPEISRQAYDDRIAVIRNAIHRGETYQTNFTLRLRTPFVGSSLAFYERLRTTQRSEYCAYLNIGGFTILSASPELFFRTAGRTITARPMKGTSRRGRWTEEDEALSEQLLSSGKNRAENLMIVDLLRNDLSRIAEPGTVHVPRMLEIEQYPTLLQMTSTVTAQLRPDVGIEAIFEALFPCGSITGAPKISTMRLIAEVEDSPRQVYCGAIGWIAPTGDAVFNVPIRTVIVDSEKGLAEYGAGGGITWDSAAKDEYEETLLKAALLTEPGPDFQLLETIRLEDGVYAWYEEHLARLLNSAIYFGFSVCEVTLREALVANAVRHSMGLFRVRLLVTSAGEVKVESAPLGSLPPGPLCVGLALTPVCRQNRFLYHKTTHRAVYEGHRAAQPELFDVLLYNEEGELTEFTIGNLVVELEGRLYTPPRDCGLLCGVYRDALVRQGEVQERVLSREDLTSATGLWLVNSVRGKVPVTNPTVLHPPSAPLAP